VSLQSLSLQLAVVVAVAVDTMALVVQVVVH
jgi:hypothetical protein